MLRIRKEKKVVKNLKKIKSKKFFWKKWKDGV